MEVSDDSKLAFTSRATIRAANAAQDKIMRMKIVKRKPRVIGTNIWCLLQTNQRWGRLHMTNEADRKTLLAETSHSR
jgi:hypothetical protein